MNNLFLVDSFDWGRRNEGKWMRRAQSLLARVRIPWLLRRAIDPNSEMTTVEARQNLWHFAMQTLAYNVRGDFAAFGCFDGKTAVIYQKVLDEFGSDRQLHLYDHFRIGFHLQGCDIRAEVERNFRAAGVRPPIIHEGDVRLTIPSALPAEIACMDIDCGYGGDSELHEATVLHLLEHVYPRMTPGAIGILMDYHELDVSPCRDCNPGVGRACQKFFANRVEKVSPIWAGEYPQGYFRKR